MAFQLRLNLFGDADDDSNLVGGVRDSLKGMLDALLTCLKSDSGWENGKHQKGPLTTFEANLDAGPGESLVRIVSSKPKRNVPRKLRFQILKRDGYKCRLCGRRASDFVRLDVDHIIPLDKWGSNAPSNLQTLCDDCNGGKGVDLL